MLTQIWLSSLVCFLVITSTRGQFLEDPEVEALDEVRDAEIFRDVLISVLGVKLRQLQNHRHKRYRRDEEVICYPGLGCFYDEGFFDYVDYLPSHPEDVDTQFFLYNYWRRETPVKVSYYNRTQLGTAVQNGSLPTKIIIHGFGSSCNRIWAREMRLALMYVSECNIICVDWEKGAALPDYARAAVNTRLVGKQVALLVKMMNAEFGTTAADFHLIGFSLGAHVAGFAGAELQNLSRITGLDPAGPLFESYGENMRLDASDANFVDVIHSNGGSLLTGGLGAWEPMGHVDFYPNGGQAQKGCTNLFVGAMTDFLWSSEEVEGRSLCNHRRAYKFFTDSVVEKCPFPSFACDDYEKFLEGECFPCGSDVGECGNMGYFADRAAGRGKLYLVTREEEPFCANQYKVELYSSATLSESTFGKIEITVIGAENNETFTLTDKDDHELVAGERLVKIIVPHPILEAILDVEMRYTPYQGWISSGHPKWAIDKLTITDSFGKILSFCQKGKVLPSDLNVRLPIGAKDCQLSDLQRVGVWGTLPEHTIPKRNRTVPGPNEVRSIHGRPPHVTLFGPGDSSILLLPPPPSPNSSFKKRINSRYPNTEAPTTLSTIPAPLVIPLENTGIYNVGPPREPSTELTPPKRQETGGGGKFYYRKPVRLRVSGERLRGPGERTTPSLRTRPEVRATTTAMVPSPPTPPLIRRQRPTNTRRTGERRPVSNRVVPSGLVRNGPSEIPNQNVVESSEDSSTTPSIGSDEMMTASLGEETTSIVEDGEQQRVNTEEESDVSPAVESELESPIVAVDDKEEEEIPPAEMDIVNPRLPIDESYPVESRGFSSYPFRTPNIILVNVERKRPTEKTKETSEEEKEVEDWMPVMEQVPSRWKHNYHATVGTGVLSALVGVEQDIRPGKPKTRQSFEEDAPSNTSFNVQLLPHLEPERASGRRGRVSAIFSRDSVPIDAGAQRLRLLRPPPVDPRSRAQLVPASLNAPVYIPMRMPFPPRPPRARSSSSSSSNSWWFPWNWFWSSDDDTQRRDSADKLEIRSVWRLVSPLTGLPPQD